MIDLQIEIVCATPLSEDDFWLRSPLGNSLQRIGFDARVATCIHYENRLSPAEAYNDSIAAERDSTALVFVQDDLWLQDYFLVDRLSAGLDLYDVVGLAGCVRRVKDQSAWFSDGPGLQVQHGFLSGVLGQGASPLGNAHFFGPVPAECELLDGGFLAASRRTLVDHQLLFDPELGLHFHDMDFCRSARQRGMKLGTCQVSATRQSQGAYGTPAWADGYRAYLAKWGS